MRRRRRKGVPGGKTMQGKVALEEHIGIEETSSNFGTPFPDHVWKELKGRLLDIHGRRLALMDEHGIEIMLLSLNAPAIQGIPDTAQAEKVARKANDYLAEQVHKRPDRFQALAALPMQDPERAARELERCVKELGFCGALVNGFSEVGDAALYYDLPQYRPFWATVERLDVPFYLHPRNPLPRDAKIYEGHPWLLGPVWAFGQETAVHALRLMGSGLFDAHPRLQIILGHLGENLPYAMWRVDHANAWVESRSNYAAKKPMRDYFIANFNITTSGNFHTPSLLDAMMVLGADRIMFSVDWPFENVDHAANWFDACPISENDRLKIGRTNALRLFKLGKS
jgi:2,3-dihydroxybenzoate decarboxylase